MINDVENSARIVARAPNMNAALVLADGSVFYGRGIGIEGRTVGEICFNTAMTGYQEIMTDPSYCGQIITFTFPHIGNVGANNEDVESRKPFASGLILRTVITDPANFRSEMNLNDWLKKNKITGISGVDTRALTIHIRKNGAQNVGIIFSKNLTGADIEQLAGKVRKYPDMNGLELAGEVSCAKPYDWDETRWSLETGYGKQENPKYHVVAIDYGAKRNILRSLADLGCKVTIVPAQTSAKEILAYNPDGIFLSNGPGDPAATGKYAVPIIKELLDTNLPLFGICLGHQLLALTLGCKTEKMHQGHRGANHPVKNLETDAVEITSQNHGFIVKRNSMPKDVLETHVSLFDNTVEGLKLRNKPVFSVQYHPEASPGPHDSRYLFMKFIEMIEQQA